MPGTEGLVGQSNQRVAEVQGLGKPIDKRTELLDLYDIQFEPASLPSALVVNSTLP
jgi:hypothetical protein